MAAKFIRSIPGSQEPLDSPYQERDKEGSTAHCSTMECRILSYAVSSPSSYAFLGQLLDQIYRGRETREMLRESRYGFFCYLPIDVDPAELFQPIS